MLRAERARDVVDPAKAGSYSVCGAEDGNRIFSINRVLVLLGPHYTPKNAPKFAPHSLTQSVKNISKCWPNPSIMYLDQSRPSAHPDAPHRSSYGYAVVRSMAMTDNGPKRLRDACNHNNKAPYYYGNTLWVNVG